MFHWLAGGKQATFYGGSWMDDPALWWQDIYLINAAYEGAIKETGGDKEIKLPIPTRFEDIGDG